MSPLGTIIYNDGIADGISQNALENAKKLFANGVAFEIVRNSITVLSDEVLQELYNEVMESTKS